MANLFDFHLDTLKKICVEQIDCTVMICLWLRVSHWSDYCYLMAAL